MDRSLVLLRIAAALGGGYGLATLAVLALGGWLARWGLPASDAVVTAAMAGFLVYLGIILWGLACASLARLCGWMCAMAAGLAGLWWAAH